MKGKKLLAGLMAVAIALTTVFSSGNIVYAEEGNVTDTSPLGISIKVENEVGIGEIADEDEKVIAETFGYSFFEGSVIICKENTSVSVDWEKSRYKYEDVYVTEVFCPVLYRDENDNLVIEKDENGYIKTSFKSPGLWNGNKISEDGRCEGSYFDLRDTQYHYNHQSSQSINERMGLKSFLTWDSNLSDFVQKPITDVYVVRFYYTTDGKGNLYAKDIDGDERTYGATDYWFLPEGVSTVLNLEGMTSDTEQSEEYVLDLSSSNATISSQDFATLLETNKTKDIVIKSNNNVTLTFTKGTMQAVDGKSSYDFSTTLNTVYTADMPYYITQSNFVSQIKFNYSGKLPAEASIRFPVGKQYAGKTLYYSLMNEDKTYAEVQAVTVDAEGYMTVKQNHCSTYVVTTENPKNKILAKPKTLKLSKTKFTYNGKAQKPSVTVKDSKGKTIAKDFYTVSYKNNKNVGIATVTVTFKGIYSGKLSGTFQIVPKKTSISSIKGAKKGFTVKWKKQTSQTTGYQIQYSTSSKFTTKTTKTVTVSKKATSKSISKLKAKKKYYVRVRTYKSVKYQGKTKKLYSDWSKNKTVVTKR